MNIIERIKKSNLPKWKLAVGGVLIVFAILVGAKLVAKAVRIALYGGSFGKVFTVSVKPGTVMPMPGMSGGVSYGGAPMMPEYDVLYQKDEAVSSISRGGIGGGMMPMYGYGYAVGGDAENFETTQYYGRYETSRLDRVCGEIQTLKSKNYVVFLNSSKDEYRCNYSFKVENGRVPEIRSILESLNPRLFTANTETLQPILDQYITEKEILQKKLESIEDMLTDAGRTYEEIRDIAADARDVDTLGKIISNHLALIERLTAERLSVKAELDRISKAESMQTDRLVYTQFQIDVEKKEVFDFRSISDSWFESLKQFVQNLNMFAQGISLGLVSFVLFLIPILLYVFIILVVIKYSWRFVKSFWKR